MKDRFRRLRGRMVTWGIDQLTLAGEINRGKSYVSERMNSKAPWDLDDIYAICRVLEIPHSEIYLYFPPAPAEPQKRKGAKNGTKSGRSRQPAAANLKAKRDEAC